MVGLTLTGYFVCEARGQFRDTWSHACSREEVYAVAASTGRFGPVRATLRTICREVLGKIAALRVQHEVKYSSATTSGTPVVSHICGHRPDRKTRRTPWKSTAKSFRPVATTCRAPSRKGARSDEHETGSSRDAAVQCG